MDQPVSVLVVEDAETDFRLIEHHLQRLEQAVRCVWAPDAEAVADALGAGPWDVVLSDFEVPGLDFHDNLARIRRRCPEVPVILVAGSISEAMAIELLQGGVADFVLKNNLARLPAAVRRVLRETAERRARRAAQAALRASRAQLQTIFDTLAEGIVLANLRGEPLYWNRAALDLHGYANLDECRRDARALAGGFAFATLQGEAVPAEQWPLARVLRGEVVRDLELQVRRQDQGWSRIFSYNGSPVRDPEAGPLMALLSIRDITERVAHEQEQRWANLLFANTQDGAVVTDRQGNIVAINPAFSAITGFAEAEILGDNMRCLKSEQHDPAFYQQMWQAILSAGSWQGEIWDRRKSGEVFLARLGINAVRDRHGDITHFVGVLSDITRLKHAHQMEYLAYHDPLTGLPNRLHLLSRLEHALEICRRHRSQGAVLFVDLDRFKLVNDTWGHPAGDELLQEVARRLLARLRDMDTLARVGGDEFVAVLEDIDGSECAAKVAGDVVRLLGEPFLLSGGQTAHIGGSVGIALFPTDGDHAEALLRQADAALYRAKGGGRNAYRFHA